MLISRSCQASTKPSVSRRMKPARHDELDAAPRGSRGPSPLRKPRAIGEGLVVDDGGRHAGLARALQALRIRPVGQHQHDFGRESATSARRRSAPAGCCRGRRSGPRPSAAPSLPITSGRYCARRSLRRHRRAARSCRCGAPSRLLAQHLRDASASLSGAATTTMPMPQLKVRAMSSAARRRPSSASGTPAAASSSRRRCRPADPSGSTRGMFSIRPPPVICARAPCTAAAPRIAASTLFT